MIGGMRGPVSQPSTSVGFRSVESRFSSNTPAVLLETLLSPQLVATHSFATRASCALGLPSCLPARP
jgi:hypothetical protein